MYTPASSARFVTYRMFVKPSFFLNLPGWRWGSITQNPLVAVSRPLHSGVCETRQDIGLPVLHSEISDSGLLRTRGDQQDKQIEDINKSVMGFARDLRVVARSVRFVTCVRIAVAIRPVCIASFFFNLFSSSFLLVFPCSS